MTAKGAEKEAWVVDYVDQKGKRHLKTLPKKKDADAFAATAAVEVREGTHTPASARRMQPMQKARRLTMSLAHSWRWRPS